MTKRKSKNRKTGIKKPTPENALLGTALITNFVRGRETKMEDKPILDAIKDSVWSVLRSNQPAQAKAYWAMAAILASYNLGREGTKLPPRPDIPQNLENKPT